MGLKEFFEKVVEKRKRFKEMEDEARMQQRVQERMKPATQRELEMYLNEENERVMKKQLEYYKKKKKEEMWHGNIFKQPNIFGNEKSIFSQKSILSEKRAWS